MQRKDSTKKALGFQNISDRLAFLPRVAIEKYNARKGKREYEKNAARAYWLNPKTPIFRLGRKRFKLQVSDAEVTGDVQFIKNPHFYGDFFRLGEKVFELHFDVQRKKYTTHIISSTAL